MSGFVLALLVTTGCGANYRFAVTSPDVPMADRDLLTYRMIGETQTGSGTDLVTCEDGVCVTGGMGADEIELGTEILAWLDVAGDDFEAFRDLDPRGDITLLAPDPEDPRGEATWEGGIYQRIEVELRLP